MYKFFTIFGLILLLKLDVFSQNFNVAEVDVSKYPIVSANFSAFDFQGKPYTNLTSNDFTVRDNGILIPPSLVNISCTVDAPYNVVIVIDKSSSMMDRVEGQLKWEWAVEGVKAFVNNVPLGDSSRMALTSFSGRADILCPFTKSKQEILDSLKNIPYIYGSTNFNVAFLDDMAGAINLLKDQNPNYKRAIVFLSDGEHSNLNEPFQLDNISQKLREFNIQVFAVTLLSTKSTDLESLAKRTGGYYDFVSSKTQLIDLYKKFSSELQLRQLCTIEWENPDICDDFGRYRNANIKFNILGINVGKKYLVPNYSIVKIESDQQSYDFANPEIGNYEERDITIIPKVKNFTAHNIKIIPEGYFEIIDWGDGIGNKPSYDFIMPVDVPRTLKIRFTPQVTKKYRKATLVFEGDPCPKEIALIGGYHRINLTKPVQGNYFSQCDSIDIVWNGNEPDAILDLYYSTDGGNNWNDIVRKITGYTYKWKCPVSSENLKIKIESTPGYEFNFANSFGGLNDDIVTSMCITDNGIYHFVTGYFSGELNIGSTKLISKGKEDIFLAKFDNEGNFIWANSAGSISFNDRAYGVVADHEGYVYITGYTYNGITFDNSVPKLAEDNTPYFFVAKYSESGSYVNSKFIGATSYYTDFKAEGTKIGFEYLLGQQPKLMVEGSYSGEYTDYNLNVYLPPTASNKPFSVAMSTDLELTEMYAAAKSWKYTNKNASFINEAFYETDNFTGSKNIDRFNLISNGKTDFWISKYSKIAQSIDISGTFGVIRQTPSLTKNLYNYNDVVYGDSVSVTLTKTLYNPYPIPIEITDYSFNAIADSDIKNDYTLVKDIIGKKINGYDSIDLVIQFKPNYTGPRNAWLIINSSCGDDVRLDLLGNGVCGGSSLPLYDFGNQNLKKTRKDTIKCAFENISNVKIVVYPLVRGANFGDFTLEIPDYYNVYNGRITVNPGECLDLIVTFNPKDLGERIANINFNVEKPCKNSILELKGNGISSDVTITSFSWGEKRVNGVYPAKLFIKNNSEGTEKIDSIKFVDPNFANTFDLIIDSKDYPKDIAPNFSMEVDVNYKPKFEQSDNADIYCYVNSRAEPLVAKLDGIGIMPKMIATWNCGNEVNIGDTTIATLTIENPSQSADLKIDKIGFEKTMVEFTFQNPDDIVSRTIIKGDKISIPVIYTPRANSTNSNVVNIFADDYDGQFSEQWKLTKVDASCDGVHLDYNDINFGNTLICSNNQKNILIKNISKSKDVTLFLSQAIFSEHSDLFKLDNVSDVVVGASKEVNIPISFKSKEIGDYSVKLTIPNSANYKVELVIKASSDNYVPSTDLKTANFDVADIFNYSIQLKIPQLESRKVENLTLVLNFDPFVIQYKANSFKSSLNNWNWTPKYLGNGKLEISGNGTLTDNQTINAFSLDFVVLLNDKHKTDISATTIFDCKEFNYDLSVINSNLVCFNDNRILFRSGNAQFILKDIAPNPVVESTKIEFGLGFEVDTKIDIVNANGEIIETLIYDKLPSGYFEANLNTSKYNNGIYFVRMFAGPYSTIKKIIIVK